METFPVAENPICKRILSQRLSDGGRVEVTKLGRYYNFNRYYPGETPTNKIRISKNEAMRLYADAIRSDVLELDNPITPDRIELVHLWDPLTTSGPIYAVFVDGVLKGTQIIRQPKSGIKVYRGKERTRFLQSKGLVLDPQTKRLRPAKR